MGETHMSSKTGKDTSKEVSNLLRRHTESQNEKRKERPSYHLSIAEMQNRYPYPSVKHKLRYHSQK